MPRMCNVRAIFKIYPFTSHLHIEIKRDVTSLGINHLMLSFGSDGGQERVLERAQKILSSVYTVRNLPMAWIWLAFVGS